MKQPLTTKEVTLITGIAVGVVVVLILWLSASAILPEFALNTEVIGGPTYESLIQALNKVGNVALSLF